MKSDDRLERTTWFIQAWPWVWSAICIAFAILTAILPVSKWLELYEILYVAIAWHAFWIAGKDRVTAREHKAFMDAHRRRMADLDQQLKALWS